MTVPNDKTYNPACHLSCSDIAVDDPADPGVMRVTIKNRPILSGD